MYPSQDTIWVYLVAWVESLFCPYGTLKHRGALVPRPRWTIKSAVSQSHTLYMQGGEAWRRDRARIKMVRANMRTRKYDGRNFVTVRHFTRPMSPLWLAVKSLAIIFPFELSLPVAKLIQWREGKGGIFSSSGRLWSMTSGGNLVLLFPRDDSGLLHSSDAWKYPQPLSLVA